LVKAFPRGKRLEILRKLIQNLNGIKRALGRRIRKSGMEALETLGRIMVNQIAKELNENKNFGKNFRICDTKEPIPLDPMHVEEPTLSVFISVNDGPLAGTEGKHVTSNKIKDRLQKEMETNIAMKMESLDDSSFKVSGRGELQIAILAENMRREGFEFLLARPQVVIKEESGLKLEPFEYLVIDVPEEFRVQ